MNRKRRRVVRLLAILLAILLAGGAVVSAIISIAYAEEALPAPHRCTLTMEYLEDEQALRMSQRLVYTNNSGRTLDRVLFYAPANLFRRQSTLPYEGQTLIDAFPAGYLPGGIDLSKVCVDGAEADWGFQGEAEMYLRVACALEPGEQCIFTFDYYLLLTENAAFLGASAEDWRLSDFYFAPAATDEAGEFILNAPLSFARYIDAPAMDFDGEIVLPDRYLLAATGAEAAEALENHAQRWTIHAESVRDFSLCFSQKYRKFTRQTDSGVELCLMTNVRGAADDVLDVAAQAVETCERWFGPLPFRQIDMVQVDCAENGMNRSACLWLSKSLIRAGGDDLSHAIRRFIAAQYFGCAAYARPSSDAWLSDSVSEYLAYLLLEEAEGKDAYLAALNARVVDSLQLTIPGGLNVSSDAALFTAEEYAIVVRNRGAAVFHELRTAMGRSELISALRRFYEKGRAQDVLSEMDLVRALDEASGKSWEKFLTDWVFHIGEYVNQSIDWLD